MNTADGTPQACECGGISDASRTWCNRCLSSLPKPKLPERIEKATLSLLEWCAAELDHYEGMPRKYGENELKRRYYELLTALQEIGVPT